MEFMQKVKMGIIVAVAIVVLIIVFQNTASVGARMLFISVEMPLFALLLLNLAIGFGLGWLTSALLRRRKAKDAQV